jgi:hypothetical protein
MTLTERLRADYAGRGLSLGRHPMARQRPCRCRKFDSA